MHRLRKFTSLFIAAFLASVLYYEVALYPRLDNYRSENEQSFSSLVLDAISFRENNASSTQKQSIAESPSIAFEIANENTTEAVGKNNLPAGKVKSNTQVIRTKPAQRYEHALRRTVNLICDSKRGLTSATGVIVDNSGTILTNAHVSEGLVRPRCLVRTGLPAADLGYAELVFIPNSYKQASSTLERSRNDISFWKLRSSPQNSAAFHTFFFSIAKGGEHYADEQLYTFSYPTELIPDEFIIEKLFPTYSETTIVRFDQYFIETEMSVSSQKGSSGGGLIDAENGDLAGLIFAVSDTVNVNNRYLFSIQADRIRQIVKTETGQEFEQFLQHLK